MPRCVFRGGGGGMQGDLIRDKLLKSEGEVGRDVSM